MKKTIKLSATLVIDTESGEGAIEVSNHNFNEAEPSELERFATAITGMIWEVNKNKRYGVKPNRTELDMYIFNKLLKD
jgi:hypothetical protein